MTAPKAAAGIAPTAPHNTPRMVADGEGMASARIQMRWSDELARVRHVALSLPEATEVAVGAAERFCAGRRVFAVFQEHQDRPCLVVPVRVARAARMQPDPRVFACVDANGGHQIGLYLDASWTKNELVSILHEAYRLVAPARLVAALDDD